MNQLVVVAYNVADTYWLSNYSEQAVAVPRQMWPILMLFQALANAITAANLSIIPQYVEIIFRNATLRVYKGHNFVEATQADRLQMEGTLWDYARYKGGLEKNIIDGLNTNGPPNDPTWNTLYSSSANPGWMEQ